MHVEVVTFDRVFDIQRRFKRSKTDSFTVFSFEYQGRKHYHIRIERCPELTQGHRVAFALRQPGEWQKVYAFKNLTTGELASRKPKKIIANMVKPAVLLVPLIHFFDTATSELGRFFLGLGVVFLVSVFVSLARQFRRIRNSITALNNINTATEFDEQLSRTDTAQIAPGDKNSN